MPREGLGGARTPTPSIPNLAAQRSRARALRSWARAQGPRRAPARARSRSPARRSGSGSRARALGASLVRLLHSLRAEWSVGSSCGTGWEGRRRGGEAAPRSGGGAAAGGGGERGSRAGGKPGWAHAPPAFLPSPRCLLQAITAPCPGVLEPSRPRGFFSCFLPPPPPQNPEPRTQTSERITPFFLCQSHSPAFV